MELLIVKDTNIVSKTAEMPSVTISAFVKVGSFCEAASESSLV